VGQFHFLAFEKNRLQNGIGFGLHLLSISSPKGVVVVMDEPAAAGGTAAVAGESPAVVHKERSKKRAIKVYVPEEHGANSSDYEYSESEPEEPKRKKMVMTPEDIEYVRSCIAPSRERDRKTRNNKHAYLKEMIRRVQSEQDARNQAHGTELEMALEQMGRGMATTPGRLRQIVVTTLPFLALGLGTIGVMGAFK
jgi:hypothetical protein